MRDVQHSGIPTGEEGHVPWVPLWGGGTEIDLISKIIDQPFGTYWSEIR